MKYGYQLGAKSIDALVNGGLMNRATKAATIMGLTVIGGMIASMVNFNVAAVVKMGDISFSIQTELLDAICPKILPLLLTFAVYHALMKGKKPVTIMVVLIVAAIAMKFFGII